MTRVFVEQLCIIFVSGFLFTKKTRVMIYTCQHNPLYYFTLRGGVYTPPPHFWLTFFCDGPINMLSKNQLSISNH